MTDDESYNMLTTNLDSRIYNIVAHKADVIATIQVEKACAFSLNCVQLALTLNNLGCVSTIQVEKTRFFL